MGNTIANVVAGRPKATGGAYAGPLGTTLPTDATTALDEALLALGYIGDAGVTETVGRTTTTVQAWGGDVVKVLQTDFTVTYQLTLIEALTGSAAKAVHGSANVVVTAANSSHGNQLAVSVVSAPLPKQVWDFEIADGDTSIRVVLPEGQITTVGDVTYSDSAVIAYPVTIQAFPDDSGVCAYKYSDDGATT